MPLFFGVIGIVLIICAINNTLSAQPGSGGLGDLVHRDFTGSNNFLVWVVAIVTVGMFGLIPKFKPVSYSFLVLIFVAIVLSNQKGGGDLFAKFFSAVQGAGTNSYNPTPTEPSSSSSSTSGGSSNGLFGGFLQQISGGSTSSMFGSSSGLSGSDPFSGSGGDTSSIADSMDI